MRLEERIFNVTITAPILLAGIAGNVVLASVMSSQCRKTYRLKCNAYLMALAIFDLIFLLSTALPNVVRNVVGFDRFPDTWLNVLTCISYASSASSTLTKMFFCIEQLLNIYLPYRLFVQVTFTKPLLEITLAAAFSTLHSVLWIVNDPVWHHEEKHEISIRRCNFFTERSNNFELLCLTDFYLLFAFPFLVICVASSLVARRILKLGLNEDLFQGVRETKVRINRSCIRGREIAKRVAHLLHNLPIVVDLQNATQLLLAMSTIFIVSSMPFRLFTHIAAIHFGDSDHIEDSDDTANQMLMPGDSAPTVFTWFKFTFTWIWYSNSAICPIGYYILSERFRRNVSQLCFPLLFSSKKVQRRNRSRSRRSTLNKAALVTGANNTNGNNCYYYEPSMTATNATVSNNRKSSTSTRSIYGVQAISVIDAHPSLSSISFKR